ncbi:Translation machinery-associated protein 46 [Tieghemiomyces parasiticus]|uniref:Translation machinery-associated protein 46 n=1 Tax=Tieghemiomyces parasiticus TaxID=78921 RepID=A0A9W7ZTE4_9FUNG|nr:Translation machinery-associated protein 46 [Tieghemiomyces parasiticus]
MPPKKNNQMSNKSKDKAKQKVIEDKTFGLKNKNKSVKVGRYVQEVEKQVMTAGNKKLMKEADERKAAIKNKKEAEAKKQAELDALFKPVQVSQKVPFGVDPKTVLCVNFKAGNCQKGDRCRFSHDLNVGRKIQKVDLYTDTRAETNDDTMEKWDQDKLESVVTSKHGNPRTTTEIVCKYFLEAIETQKYGWFWECPNGGTKCQYRHALPKGFVFKAKGAKKDSEKDEISLEDFLETERHKLGTNLTPVTLESFTEWKKNRQARKDEAANDKLKAKEAAFKAGRAVNMSGRDFFHFNPDLLGQGVEDDEGDVFDFKQYQSQDGEKDTGADEGTRLAEKMADTSIATN